MLWWWNRICAIIKCLKKSLGDSRCRGSPKTFGPFGYLLPVTNCLVRSYISIYICNKCGAVEKSGPNRKKRGQQQTRETPDCQVGPDDEWTSRRTIIYNRRPVDIFSQRDVYCYGCCCCCSFPSIFLHAPSQILFGGRHSLITQSQHKRIDGPGNFPLSLFVK